MDFGFSEEQQALQDLLKKIFRELCTTESLAALEAKGESLHRPVWDALAKAQLLGLALPQELGGGGLGLVELCLLLEQAGAAACPSPLLAALVMAALPIAEFGTAAQSKTLLEPLCRGQSILTAALVESAEPVVAKRDGGGFTLTGTKDCVPALQVASHVLVPARTAPSGALGVFILDPKADGVTTTKQIGTSGELLGRMELAGVRAPADALLGGAEAGAAIIDWTLERSYLGQCALQLGLTRRALELTAKYATERHQFGRPIGTFQAVAQRAGDAYIDVEMIRLTLWRAAWLIDRGLPARREVAVAKLVAAEAAHRVVCAAQHIHGGVGFDRDFPLHRYFLQSKQNEFTLGSAKHHLARLGKMIASEDRS
jgi:alkylation response protein AidB-like acyl-CoA dehydrogenase